MSGNLKYHHLGIPTNEKHDGEVYLENFKVHVSGYDTSPFKIEWMRFEEGAPSPELVRQFRTLLSKLMIYVKQSKEERF